MEKERNKSESRILVNGTGFKAGCQDKLRMGLRQEEASRQIWAWDSGLMAVRAQEVVSSGEGLQLFLSLGFLLRFILGLGTGCATDGVM